MDGFDRARMLSGMACRISGIVVIVALACAACGQSAAAPGHPGHPGTVLRDAPVAGRALPKASGLPRRPRGAGAYLMARLRVPLRTPFGPVRPRTPFGDPVWVPVLAHHGMHATVLVPARPHARTASLDLRSLALRWTRVRIVVDLGSARMTVMRGVRPLRSFPIGEGTPQTPTPVGRFFVTDRLAFPAGSPYAPLAFALAAHQTHLAPTWVGGDQIAIHPGPMGPVSNGCIHVDLGALSLLRRVAALGTIVTVRARA
jgi:hypothetical protein